MGFSFAVGRYLRSREQAGKMAGETDGMGPSPAPQPGMPLNPVERGAQPGCRDEAATGPSAPGGCAPGEAGGHGCRRVACGW